MRTLGFEDSDVISLLLLNRVFRVGTDQTGQYLNIELDLRQAPLIINESGCNANTKTVSIPREKLRDKLVLDGRKRQICVHETLIFGSRQTRPWRKTAKHFAQRMCEPRECDFIPLKRAARYLVGKPKLHCDFEDKNTLTKSPSSWTAISLAIGGSDW